MFITYHSKSNDSKHDGNTVSLLEIVKGEVGMCVVGRYDEDGNWCEFKAHISELHGFDNPYHE